MKMTISCRTFGLLSQIKVSFTKYSVTKALDIKCSFKECIDMGIVLLGETLMIFHLAY